MRNIIRPDNRTWAEIDLSALLHNYNYIKERAKEHVVMCVVKADAYGHGAVRCSKYLEKNGAEAFAVACLDEAIELREGGITKPILILGYTSPEFVRVLAGYDIMQSFIGYPHAVEISDAAKAAGVTIKGHIQIDTGMSRTGIFAQGDDHIDAAIDVVAKAFELPNIIIDGMFTHMAAADTPSEIDYTQWQIDNFRAVRDGLLERGFEIPYCHVANSACIIDGLGLEFNMVRAGILLYGLYPDNVHREGPLQPVMTLKSRITQIRSLPKGTAISYGKTFVTCRNMTSAVIGIGYADGYPRRLSNSAQITIHGKRYPQVGRVCMDAIMADITGLGDEAKRNDEVILWGNGGSSVEEVAQAVGTINYEITCGLSQRAKRVYINE